MRFKAIAFSIISILLTVTLAIPAAPVHADEITIIVTGDDSNVEIEDTDSENQNPKDQNSSDDTDSNDSINKDKKSKDTRTDTTSASPGDADIPDPEDIITDESLNSNETDNAVNTGDIDAANSDDTNSDETESDDDDTEEDDLDTDDKCSFGDKSKTLYVGWEKYYSEIFGVDEDAVITFRSKNEKIATVDSEGVITPVKKGNTRIYADIDENGKTSKCSIKITVEEPFSRITDYTNAMTLDSRYTFKLERTGHAEPVTWTLEGEGLAELEAVSSTDCSIHTLKPGFVTLTAECRGEKASFKIKIYDGTGELFIISPDSQPYKGWYKTYNTYNKKTKGYYLLRSYLERLDTLKGGVLVLRCGKYTVTNTLCIPSDTTIILEDGATIVKTDDTGTKNLTATASLFQTVSYTNSSKDGVFKGYKGEHDIKILGEGTATIDLNNIACQGIAAAHCNRLTISGISFKNMNTYHFIELAGNANVNISGNYFYGYSESKTTRKEAINLDTPDAETHGFNQRWTSLDKTPNKNITISDNVFYNVECGIGTHKYTEDKPHKNVKILRNTFIDSATYSIRCMNWDDPVIMDNSFIYSQPLESAELTVILNGVKDPVITGNLFENLETPISFYHWKNTGYGKDYAPVYNEISESCMILLKNNYLVNVANPYFEYYRVLDDYSEDNLELHPIGA